MTEKVTRHDSSPSAGGSRKNGPVADIPPTFRLSVPDDFGVEVGVEDGDVVVAVRGELDVLTAPFLWERMEPALPGVTGQPAYDQTKRLGPAQNAPLTPEAQAILKASMEDQAKGGQGNYPTYVCLSPGMPRVSAQVFRRLVPTR